MWLYIDELQKNKLNNNNINNERFLQDNENSTTNSDDSTPFLDGESLNDTD